MANTIIAIKRTTVAGRQPNTTSSGNATYIMAGSLALNMTDHILYSSDGTNLLYLSAQETMQFHMCGGGI